LLSLVSGFPFYKKLLQQAKNAGIANENSFFFMIYNFLLLLLI
jgi:hypothetical protein